MCYSRVILSIYLQKDFKIESSASPYNCRMPTTCYEEVWGWWGGMTALCVLRQPGQIGVASEGYHVVISTNIPISRMTRLGTFAARANVTPGGRC
jgi:hypothetical protein